MLSSPAQYGASSDGKLRHFTQMTGGGAASVCTKVRPFYIRLVFLSHTCQQLHRKQSSTEGWMSGGQHALRPAHFKQFSCKKLVNWCGSHLPSNKDAFTSGQPPCQKCPLQARGASRQQHVLVLLCWCWPHEVHHESSLHRGRVLCCTGVRSYTFCTRQQRPWSSRVDGRNLAVAILWSCSLSRR